MIESSGKLLALLLDSLSDTYALVLNQDYQIIYANAPFLAHFKFRGREVVGRHCFDLVGSFTPGEQGPGAFCPVTVDPCHPTRTLLTREDQGKKFFYEAIFYPLRRQKPGQWLVAVFRDVTEKTGLEQQLRQGHEMERNLVQASIDGIIVNDLEGNVLIFNEGAAKILGYAPGEVIGKMNAARFYPPSQAHEIKLKIYDPSYGGVGILENYETLAVHKDGSLIPVWLSARLLYDDGREVGIVGFFRDLRERKRLEEQVLQSERLAGLGKVVAHVTHEIKNPLMLIGGFTRQLGRLSELPPEGRRKLQIIQKEVQRLERFLADLGSFTRVAPAQKVPGSLVDLIREVAELMEASLKERRVEFHLESPTPLPSISFDPGQIRQVLINLFKNALEAMPQGGHLTARVEVKEDGLHLTISDTGQGIAPEHQQEVFTPFFTTKEGGSGLGLTICRQLIDQHRGDITIESEAGQGTSCHIRLPLNRF